MYLKEFMPVFCEICANKRRKEHINKTECTLPLLLYSLVLVHSSQEFDLHQETMEDVTCWTVQCLFNLMTLPAGMQGPHVLFLAQGKSS
jgi:hypothetical protein